MDVNCFLRAAGLLNRYRDLSDSPAWFTDVRALTIGSMDAPAMTDVALVGAGPIGLEMAVALKRSGIDYLHFDAKQIGYTVSWFAPQTRFFSSNERIAIAGVPLQTPDQSKSTREEYLAYLRTVAGMFDLEVHTYEPVTGIEQRAGGFRLTTRPKGGERRYACKHSSSPPAERIIRGG